MLDNRKIFLDSFCEVADLLAPFKDGEFWDLDQVTFEDRAVYLIGREQFHRHADRIRQAIDNSTAKIVFSNPHEGSATMLGQLERLGLLSRFLDQKFKVITGGAIGPESGLVYDSFLPKLLDYAENNHAYREYYRRWTSTRPWKFLLLNGRGRPHRQQLLAQLQNLLDQGLWTNLDSVNGPIKTLPAHYEFERYRDNSVADSGFVKNSLFAGEWGEIYLNSDLYLDTHFSIVTETVFDYPYSFRTEKIWKPIAVGHPFVVVANSGYYRDLHQLGFKTFGHLIDESFDSIENNKDRLDRISQVIRDLCQQDLAKFSEECYTICKYNHEHLRQMSVQVRSEFPKRFQQYINE